MGLRTSAGLVVAVLLLYAFALPAAVDWLVTSALRDRGFADASVRVDGVSWRRIELGDLRLDKAERLSVADVGITFSLPGLLTGKVERVELTGLTYHVGVQGGIDLGPLATLLAGRPAAPEDRSTPRLPLDRAELQASSVVVHHGSASWRIPVTGRVVRRGGALDAGAWLGLPGQPMRVRATYDLATGQTTARVVAEASEGDAKKQTGDASEPLALSLDYQPRGDAASLRVAFSGQLPRAEATMAGQRVLARQMRAAGSAELRLHSRVELLRSDLSLDAQQIAVGAQVVRGLRVGLHREPEEGRAVLGISGNGRGWSLRSVEADLPPASDAWRELPVVMPVSWAARLEVASEQPMDVAADATFTWYGHAGEPAWRFTLDSLRLPQAEGKAQQIGGLAIAGVSGELDAGGRASLTAEAIQLEALGLRVQQIDAEGLLPLAWNIGSSDARDGAGPRAASNVEPGATVTANSVTVRGVTLPGFDANLTPQSGGFELDAIWPLGSPDATVTAAGSVELDRASPRGTLAVEAPSFAIAPGQPLYRLIQNLSPWPITAAGHLGLTGEIRFDAAGIAPRLTASVTDAHLARQSGDGGTTAHELTGVDAELTLTRFAPLATPPSQRLQWTGGRLGGFEIGPGEARFRLDPEVIGRLERAVLRVNDLGTFRLFSLESHTHTHKTSAPQKQPNTDRQPQPQRHAFAVFVEDLQLGETLRLVAPERLSGKGSLHGRIPAFLDLGPPASIRFGEGYLIAEPGGELRFQNAAQAEEVLARNLPDLDLDIEGLSPAAAKRTIIEALQNFRYDRLRVAFISRDEQLDLRIVTSGTGRGDINVPVQRVTVNVRNFGALLEQALRVQAGMDRGVEWSADTINQENAEDQAILDLFE